MNKFRVCYVTKISRGALKGDISHIGGIHESGGNWNTSITDAMEGITSGTSEFYVMDKLERIKVSICSYNDSETFLSAKGRGYLHNLLEDLPDCSLMFHL